MAPRRSDRDARRHALADRSSSSEVSATSGEATTGQEGPDPGRAGAQNRVADRPLVITPREAASLLGVSRSTAYELVRTGVLPALRLGPRLTLIPREAIDVLIRRAYERCPDWKGD